MIINQKLLYKSLQKAEAPRVFTNSELLEYLEKHIPDLTKKRFLNLLDTALAFNAVQKIKHGLFINKLSPFSVSPSEAAVKIRANAIVSLYTVLSDANILNNYTSNVYAILPISEDNRPNTGTIKADTINYHFFGIKKEVLEAGDRHDKFVPNMEYERHTPEAAIVYSMYLHNTTRSHYPMLDTQIDVDNFDHDKLLRLAEAVGLYEKTNAYLKASITRQELDDNHSNWSPH